jgi:hypothetical protein
MEPAYFTRQVTTQVGEEHARKFEITELGEQAALRDVSHGGTRENGT